VERATAACRENNEELLSEVLGESNASTWLNQRDAVGSTALHYAAEFGSVQCLALLTKTPGIALEMRDQMNKETPLLRCVKSQRQTAQQRLACLELLIHAGANVSVRDGSGRLAEDLLPSDETQARALLQQARMKAFADVVDDDEDEDDDGEGSDIASSSDDDA
jgi:ankyrin repeat protein